MKNLLIATAALAASLAAAAPALAQPFPDPYGDGTVARADEEAKAAERFAAADSNKDGAISEDEMTAASQGQGQRGGGLRRADANGDGRITKDEYVTAQLRRFDMQDANKDGQLTKAERDAARAERMNGGGWGGPRPGGE